MRGHDLSFFCPSLTNKRSGVPVSSAWCHLVLHVPIQTFVLLHSEVERLLQGVSLHEGCHSIVEEPQPSTDSPVKLRHFSFPFFFNDHSVCFGLEHSFLRSWPLFFFLTHCGAPLFSLLLISPPTRAVPPPRAPFSTERFLSPSLAHLFYCCRHRQQVSAASLVLLSLLPWHLLRSGPCVVVSQTM